MKSPLYSQYRNNLKTGQAKKASQKIRAKKNSYFASYLTK
ncbi:hypothetical protein A33Q_2631 [Indibacter alkaliphilus LW1]|uniref:Uncharacterized protein n=1 Tax=Indibacter alkaliphilus (strain CCUG 57479 / KCTC 22604 / LW1) TaxID=1189612 RepID=S2E1U3_INDAL|nr:hypothetical protein A33Q_2631 [Indibacter alkaliphilus LW1]